jgi:hypothetical protein
VDEGFGVAETEAVGEGDKEGVGEADSTISGEASTLRGTDKKLFLSQTK